MRRASFVASSAVAAFAPAIAVGQASTTIRLASAPDEDVIGALWGIEGGGFRRVGLDVQIQRANSGAAVAAAVAGGSLEVGKSSLISLLAARNRGLPFVLIAPSGIYTAEHPVVALVVAKNSPFKTGKDLDGKVLAVPALNDLNAIAMQAWIDKNGGDSSSAKFLELITSAIPDAIASGRVDAGNIGSPTLDVAMAERKVRILGRSFTAIAPRFMQACYFASTEYIAKNRDVVNRFRRVIAESGAYANDHHDQMAPVIAKFTGMEAKVIAAQPKQLVGTVIDLKLIGPLVDAAKKYKAIPASFDTATMIDPAALT
jgi:NitT/TauT family transport system substrate-binding protein